MDTFSLHPLSGIPTQPIPIPVGPHQPRYPYRPSRPGRNIIITYKHIVTGTFVDRPNRFTARVRARNRTVICRVENIGRCRESLIPGAAVILEFRPDTAVPGRKTEYNLIGAYKNNLFINMDSRVPNKAARGWLISLGDSMGSYGCTEKAGSLFSPLGPYVLCDIRREVAHNGSRFDLAFSLRDQDTEAVSPAFMEVKGTTLKEDSVATFPDAPTEQGIKHSKGLIKAHEEGYEAYVLSVIQMKGIRDLTPNDVTYPAFGNVPRQARETGVHVLAYDCLVTPDTMIVDSPVKVILNQDIPQYTLLTLRTRVSLWEALAVSAFILNNIVPKLQVFQERQFSRVTAAAVAAIVPIVAIIAAIAGAATV